MKLLRLLPRYLASLFFVLVNLVAGPVFANCNSPVGNEADFFYNNDYSTYQFCNGTVWLPFGGGSNCSQSTNYTPVAPSGNGYFVITSATHNGNLGGLAGADALCLTELATTHTGWMGYATANANGQLVATKVHAFICGNFQCNNLMPLTKYYFASAADGTKGGAFFTTDSNGVGPNDSANWSGATYFGASYAPWSGRTDNAGNNQATAWAQAGGNNGQCCSLWTDNTVGGIGDVAGTANTDMQRWGVDGSNNTCNNTRPLICFVNP